MTSESRPRAADNAGYSPPLALSAYVTAKRAVDIAASASLLLLASPILGIVAILIKREDGGPVLYRGVRVGRYGQPFSMLKLRTMVFDADRLGGHSTPSDDARLTRTGKFLRHWKIDELPQLVNVFRGEMSLVGPRPQVLSEVATYTEVERKLLLVRPGITDWASIAFRDEGAILAKYEDPDMAYESLIRCSKSWLGLMYVETASFSTDLRILLQTISAIFFGPPRLPEIPPDAADRLGLNDGRVGQSRLIRKA